MCILQAHAWARDHHAVVCLTFYLSLRVSLFSSAERSYQTGNTSPQLSQESLYEKKFVNSREFSSDDVKMDFDMLGIELTWKLSRSSNPTTTVKAEAKRRKNYQRTKRIHDQDIREKVSTSTTRQCDETRSASGERIEDLQQRAAEFARATLSKSLSRVRRQAIKRDEMGHPPHYRGKGWLLSAIRSFK